MTYDNYESDLEIVKAYIAEKGSPIVYSTAPGNQCVWVWFGQVNQYYIVRDGKVVDIQTD